MSRYIVKRILMMIPTLFGAAFLVFFLLRLIPGDVCELRLSGTGLYVDQETIDICRYKLGLHQPMMVQFFDFLVGIVTFDLGESMWTGKPIVYEMGLRFELSLQIAIMATITSIFIAIPLGNHLCDQAGHLDRLHRPHHQYRRNRDSFFLVWNPDHFRIADFYPDLVWGTLDASSGLRPDLGRSLAQSVPVDLACSRHRLSLFRSCHQDDPIGDA